MSAGHTLGRLLRSFFEDFLPCQKGLQPTTIRSYRDAVVLYLRFAARERRCKLTRLHPQDITCERVVRLRKTSPPRCPLGSTARDSRPQVSRPRSAPQTRDAWPAERTNRPPPGALPGMVVHGRYLLHGQGWAGPCASAVPKMRVNGRGEDVIFFDGVFFKSSLKSIFFVS